MTTIPECCILRPVILSQGKQQSEKTSSEKQRKVSFAIDPPPKIECRLIPIDPPHTVPLEPVKEIAKESAKERLEYLKRLGKKVANTVVQHIDRYPEETASHQINCTLFTYQVPYLVRLTIQSHLTKHGLLKGKEDEIVGAIAERLVESELELAGFDFI
jgi:hypothetical protein